MTNIFEYKQIKELSKQIRGVTYKKSDISESPKDGYIPLLRAHNINDRTINYDKLVFIKEELVRDEQLLQNFDILIATSSGSINLVGKSAQFYNGKYEKVTFGAFCKVVRPSNKNINPKYLGYFFQSEIYRRNINKVVRGANINNLRNEHIDEQMLIFQNIETQNKIVNIIESSEFILTKRQQQIEALSALKQSIFLDMFGDPKSTENKFTKQQIGSLFEVQTGKTPSRRNSSYWNKKQIPWIKTTEVNNGQIESCSEYITEKAMNENKLKLFPENTILIAMYGQGKTRGQSGLLAFPATCNQACAALLPNEKVDMVFVWNQLLLQYENLRALGRGGNQANLNLNIVREFEVLNPPLELQNKFSAKVEEIENKIDLLSKSLNQLNKLYNSILHKSFNGELFTEETIKV